MRTFQISVTSFQNKIVLIDRATKIRQWFMRSIDQWLLFFVFSNPFFRAQYSMRLLFNKSKFFPNLRGVFLRSFSSRYNATSQVHVIALHFGTMPENFSEDSISFTITKNLFTRK